MGRRRIAMDDKKELIKKIVDIEWDMFTSVNEGEARASCQDDRVTFDGMRIAQYDAWSPEVVASFLNDVENAQKNGRNLVEEKYIHMMKTTEPIRYSALLERITVPAEAAVALAQEVSDILLEQTRVLFEDYPYVSGHGRPLYSTLDYGSISVETYQLSELLTYSVKTLVALLGHVKELEKAGVSLARLILENSVKFYGYNSLETAEAATKEQVEKQGIRISFGCCAGEECEF